MCGVISTHKVRTLHTHTHKRPCHTRSIIEYQCKYALVVRARNQLWPFESRRWFMLDQNLRTPNFPRVHATLRAHVCVCVCAPPKTHHKCRRVRAHVPETLCHVSASARLLIAFSYTVYVCVFSRYCERMRACLCKVSVLAIRGNNNYDDDGGVVNRQRKCFETLLHHIVLMAIESLAKSSN